MPEGALPAPVYFLQSGQVCSLNGYGLAVSQITNESISIESFDVSPTTGDIVFVAGNSLILQDGTGKRTVLIQGAELPPEESDIDAYNSPERIAGRIATPRWSPDGSSIAFIQNGLMLINPEDCSLLELHPNSQLPPPGENWDCTVFNSVESWSPDGERILVTAYSYPLSSIHRIYSAMKGLSGNCSLYTLIEGNVTHGWSSDGQELYLGIPGVGGQESLCRFTPPEWQNTMIGESVPARSYWFYAFPHVTPDGDVMAFVAFGQSPETPQSDYSLYRINRWGAGMTSLRDEQFAVKEVLWPSDGSGALTVNSENGLDWIPAGVGAVLHFPVSGVEMLRWGPPRH